MNNRALPLVRLARYVSGLVTEKYRSKLISNRLSTDALLARQSSASQPSHTCCPNGQQPSMVYTVNSGMDMSPMKKSAMARLNRKQLLMFCSCLSILNDTMTIMLPDTVTKLSTPDTSAMNTDCDTVNLGVSGPPAAAAAAAAASVTLPSAAAAAAAAVVHALLPAASDDDVDVVYSADSAARAASPVMLRGHSRLHRRHRPAAAAVRRPTNDNSLRSFFSNGMTVVSLRMPLTSILTWLQLSAPPIAVHSVDPGVFVCVCVCVVVLVVATPPPPPVSRPERPHTRIVLAHVVRNIPNKCTTDVNIFQYK